MLSFWERAAKIQQIENSGAVDNEGSGRLSAEPNADGKFHFMLESITRYFAGMEPGWLYAALFICSYVENVFPPVPGDTVTVFAAYLLGRSDHSAVGIMLSTTAGSSAGFMTYYALGRLLKPDYLLRRNFRFMPAAAIERAGAWFRRYGYWIIFLNRFFSGIRSVISMVAGMFRLPWIPVCIFATLGCGIWNGALIWAGYILGANWMAVERILREYNRALLILAALAIALWVIRKRILKGRTKPSNSPADQ
jgi:membrane protein DedA with SNARE-associated domain